MPDDPETLPPEEPFASDDLDEEPAGEELFDAMREMPVGTRDPNIIGDAGPFDVPPGTDPPEEGELDESPDDAEA
jgi:hypothetical protein